MTTTEKDKDKTPVPWTVRGIGLEHNLTCFVCGAKTNVPEDPVAKYMHNIAAFASTRAVANRLAACFKQGARVDYRPKEPHWIQVKVGACEKHRPVLEDLSHQWFISKFHVNIMVRAAIQADEWAARVTDRV